MWWKLVTVAMLVAGQAMSKDVRTIRMHPSTGDPIVVATLTLTYQNDKTAYRLDWHDGPFADHFLSMRPFKCLEGPSKHWCQVPYPYKNNRTLVDGDLADLEYDLLFLWKGAGEYGINMWNGVYYKLTPVEGGWDGVLHEMDMDLLASPPEDGSLRPVGAADLEPGDPDSHWLPRISIR